MKSKTTLVVGYGRGGHHALEMLVEEKDPSEIVVQDMNPAKLDELRDTKIETLAEDVRTFMEPQETNLILTDNLESQIAGLEKIPESYAGFQSLIVVSNVKNAHPFVILSEKLRNESGVRQVSLLKDLQKDLSPTRVSSELLRTQSPHMPKILQKLRSWGISQGLMMLNTSSPFSDLRTIVGFPRFGKILPVPIDHVYETEKLSLEEIKEHLLKMKIRGAFVKIRDSFGEPVSLNLWDLNTKSLYPLVIFLLENTPEMIRVTD